MSRIDFERDTDGGMMIATISLCSLGVWIFAAIGAWNVFAKLIEAIVAN